MTPLWRRYRFRGPVYIEAMKRDDGNYDLAIMFQRGGPGVLWKVMYPLSFKEMFERADSKPKPKRVSSNDYVVKATAIVNKWPEWKRGYGIDYDRIDGARKPCSPSKGRKTK